MQDFYTHSNLVELMNEHARVPMDAADGQCFHAYTLANLIKADTSTFSSVLGALATGAGSQYAGNINELDMHQRHGTYYEGLNKDSYVRPYFKASYALAFAQTVELIEHVEGLLSSNAELLQAMKNFKLDDKREGPQLVRLYRARQHESERPEPKSLGR